MRKSLLVLAVLSGLLLSPALRAACARPYQVGVSPLGWAVFEQVRKLRGYVPDLISELAARSGCVLQLQMRPRARVLLEFSRGELEVLTSAQATPERDRLGQFLPVAASELDMVARDSVPRDIRSLEQFVAQPGLTLALVRGVILNPRMDALIERLRAQGRLEQAADFDNMATRLAFGRFDAAIYPSAIHSKQIHDGLLPAGLRVIDLPESSPFAIGIYLHREKVAEADRQLMQQALRELVQEGRIEAIYRRYLSPEEMRRLFGRTQGP